MSDPAAPASQLPNMPGRSLLKRCWSPVYWFLTWLLCCYVAAAAWAWMPGSAWLAVPAGLAVFIPAWIWGFMRTKAWRAWVGRAIIVLVLVVVSAVEPSTTRAWSPDQARITTLDGGGTSLIIHDVRHCHYYTSESYDIYWESRRIDPARIDEVWYVVEPFSPGSAGAHTFLSFGINDGKGNHRYLAVSVEIRREVGESYSPLAALFRRYELMYVVADESDVIALRAIHRQHDVHLYPVKATPDQARALFLDMLDRAVALGEKPEFYHTIFNTCTTNIVDHLRRRWPDALPRWDLRILLPGNADALALERGLIDCNGSIEEVRKAHNISAVARQVGGDAPDFSARIRATIPSRSMKR